MYLYGTQRSKFTNKVFNVLLLYLIHGQSYFILFVYLNFMITIYVPIITSHYKHWSKLKIMKNYKINTTFPVQ